MLYKLRQLKLHHKLLFTLLIAVGLIGVWRGVWRLFDLYLFPGDSLATAVSSLGIGIIVLAVTHHQLA
jgi:hypothetical protein